MKVNYEIRMIAIEIQRIIHNKLYKTYYEEVRAIERILEKMTREQEAGMYAMNNKSYPQVKVGKYTICRQNEKQIWIQKEDAEGGAFLDEMFEKAIEDFFNKYF